MNIILVGVNTYKVGQNHSSTRIQFEPKNKYFKIPESYHENLTRQQLLDKLTAELKDFATTPKFRHSFFTKADVIIFETNGQTVWSKS